MLSTIPPRLIRRPRIGPKAFWAVNFQHGTGTSATLNSQRRLCSLEDQVSPDLDHEVSVPAIVRARGSGADRRSDSADLPCAGSEHSAMNNLFSPVFLIARNYDLTNAVESGAE